VQSYKNLKTLIGVRSLSTVKTYLDALNDVYLFFTMGLFDYSVKRQIYNPSKMFCVDTGLSNSVSFRFSRNSGHLLENVVYLELRRRGAELYYWKSSKGREVDFVIRQGLKIVKAVQVSQSLADEKTKDRELRALLDARKELEAEQLTVITEDEEGNITLDGVSIEIVPAWKWLIRE
jgi:predicted AAA+ superfamily ATPase